MTWLQTDLDARHRAHGLAELQQALETAVEQRLAFSRYVDGAVKAEPEAKAGALDALAQAAGAIIKGVLDGALAICRSTTRPTSSDGRPSPTGSTPSAGSRSRRCRRHEADRSSCCSRRYGQRAARADDGLDTDPFLVLEPGGTRRSIKRLDADREGRFLVTASDDKTVRVWAAEDGRLLRTLRLPAGPGDVGKAYAAAISPDGALVAAGGWTSADGGDESVYLFDRASGRLLRRVGGLPNVVTHLAFSPDGTRLAATLGGGEGVRLIDPAAGRVVAADEGYGDDSYGAAFDAAGRLATTSYDGKVRLYDPGLRLLRAAEAPGGKRPYGIAFSPDGGRLAVGYDDTTAVDVLDAGTLERLFAADTRGVDNGDLCSGRLVGGRRQPLRRRAVAGRRRAPPAPLAGGRAGRAGRPAAEPEHGHGPARAAGRAARLRRRRPAARAARRRRRAGLERGAGHRRLPRPARRPRGLGGRDAARLRVRARAASRRPCSRCRSAGWPRAGAPPASPPRAPPPPASPSRAGRTAPSRA